MTLRPTAAFPVILSDLEGTRGAGVTVQLKMLGADAATALNACAATVKLPTCVGAPVRVPSAFIVTPLGRPRAEYVIVPPTAVGVIVLATERCTGTPT